jgi:hypothetical protein
VTKKPTPAPRVVLHTPHTAAQWLVLSKAVYDSLANNKGMFATPNPALAILSADIAALDAAELATHTRTVGVIAARDAKLVIVRTDLRKVVAYVQGLVDADPANAAIIAKNAGLDLRKEPSVNKSEVSAKAGKTSGTVDATARVGGVKSAHEWEYSADGGKTWTAAPVTLQAKTTITGLIPGTSLLVRHRAVTKTGPSDWSAPVPLIVS